MNLSIMFGIINELLANKNIHAQDIAEKFEISTRSVYRYVDQMSMAGVPVFTQIGRGGGIFLDDKFIMSKTFLTKDEFEFLNNLLSNNSSQLANRIKNKLNLL